MFKLRNVFLVTVLLLSFALAVIPTSYAALASCEGIPNTSGECPMETDDSGRVFFKRGKMARYEYVTTNDTLTYEDSGKTFIMAPTTASPITITLPSATTDSLGMEFTFVADDVGATASATKYFWIDPSSLDFIVFQGTQGATNTMTAGDKLKSNGVTGDSIHLINGKALYWYVDDVRGTFTDAD